MSIIQLVVAAVALVALFALAMAGINIYRQWKGLPTSGFYALGDFIPFMGIIGSCALACFISIGIYGLTHGAV